MTQTPDGAGVARDAGPVGGTGSSSTPPTGAVRASRPEPVAETADAVAALVLTVPGVVDLHPGRFGEVATYLPGRRVTGVKLTADRVEVHVVVAFDAPVRAVAQQVHTAVGALVPVPVDVYVEDLAAAHAV